MSYPFDPPAGDVASLRVASSTLGKISNEYATQLSALKTGVQTALAQWVATRADDFQHAGQALIDEMDMMATASGLAATALWNYAGQLETAIADVAEAKRRYDGVEQPTGPDPTGSLMLAAAKQQSAWSQQATDAHLDLATYAKQAAGHIDSATDLAVPKSAGLTPDQISRKVDASMGVDNLTRGEFMSGEVTDESAWALMHTADGPVYDAGIPVPGDTGYQEWYSTLTPAQQLLETQNLQQSFVDTKQGFNPYATIHGGAIPAWATTFNDTHQNTCNVDGSMGDGYGYFGGGTIEGPGGGQWPIVMPYYSNGKYTYMDDDGQPRADGGIDQLDGHDPGWHTVDTYEGGGQFGTIGTVTKLAAGFLIATGQDLEVQQVDPDAVVIGPDGVPRAGTDVHETPTSPEDKEWWDAESKIMMPEPAEGLTAQQEALQPNLEYNKAALGGNALLIQTGQAVAAVHELDEHAQRGWYVDYQVNDDGRVRAVVRTYTAGPLEDDKTGVVGLANAFPTGQSGNTDEVPYKTRFNPYSQAVMTAVPDPDVVYSNQSDDLPSGMTGGYITERLNK